MDTTLVAEGILTCNWFVRGKKETRYLFQIPGELHQGLEIELFPSLQIMKSKNRFRQIRDPGTLSHPIDGGMDAVRTRPNPCHGVCQRQTIIVVAMQIDPAG